MLSVTIVTFIENINIICLLHLLLHFHILKMSFINYSFVTDNMRSLTPPPMSLITNDKHSSNIHIWLV